MFSSFRTPSQVMYTRPTNHSNLLSLFPIFTKHTSSILPITPSHLVTYLKMIPAPPDFPFAHSLFAAYHGYPSFTSIYSSPVRLVSFTSQLLLSIQSIISNRLSLSLLISSFLHSSTQLLGFSSLIPYCHSLLLFLLRHSLFPQQQNSCPSHLFLPSTNPCPKHFCNIHSLCFAFILYLSHYIHHIITALS